MAPHSSTLAWKIPWMEEPGSCSPWGREESDTTEGLSSSSSRSVFLVGNSRKGYYFPSDTAVACLFFVVLCFSFKLETRSYLCLTICFL